MASGSRRYYCAAAGCFSDTKKIGKYGYMSEITFHPFPTKKKAPKLRKRWLELLRRDDYDPPPHHRLCSRHFVDSRPTDDNPYPTLFEYNNYKLSKNPRATSVLDKRASASVNVDSDYADTSRCFDRSPNDANALQVAQDCSTFYTADTNSLYIPMETAESIMPVVRGEIVVTDCETIGIVETPLDHDYCSSNRQTHSDGPTYSTSGTQTDLSMSDMEDLVNAKEKLDSKDSLLRDLFIEKVTRSDQNVMKYTGIPSKNLLNGFFGILDKASPVLKYWSGRSSAQQTNYQENPGMKKSGPKRKLSKYQEFILTLVRIRLALCSFFLADIFGIANSRVSQIFNTWINFMHGIVSPLLKWPSSKTVKKFMPPCFKKSYPDTVCIIDCTEIFISRPRNPTAQSQTYSNYKHHNTYKTLVGITPSGAFSFVSKLWGGNTSDRYITERSGFLDLVKPGDEIMADRGFPIRDLLLERRAKLVIPPFTKKCKWGKGKRLTSSDVIKTKNIARLRIHVERAIGRMKNFKILSTTMPLNLKPVANQILTVCAFLCNFQKPLVKK